MESERRKFGMIMAFAVLFTLQALSVSIGYASVTLPEEEWNKTFGGTDDDRASSVQQTADGGYILAGNTYSYGAGGCDVWLVKTDSNGNKQWSKTFGGAYNDAGFSVQQTSDSGYIIVGCTWSYGAGMVDVWLIKTDKNGNDEWSKTFGDDYPDEGASVQQTSDGGYIITGYTGVTGRSDVDVCLIKTDENGNKEWNKTFGGVDLDRGYSARQTSDGGYIIAAYTISHGAGDVWLIKTDENGNKEWGKTFGGAYSDFGKSVLQTSDGGYILAGYTYSYGAGHTNFWLLKTDSSGNEEWNKTFGGAYSDFGKSVLQTSDGGYIITGETTSYGAGGRDVWLTKTDKNGKEQWNKTFGGAYDDVGYSALQTSDGGYIIAGHTDSYGAGSDDFWLVKVKGEVTTISIFDMEQSENPYPSIMGTHKGVIKPSCSINVSKMYTYPCLGTGGHTESIKLYENGELIASGTWNGYQSDWHNITLHNVSGAPYIMLYDGHEYIYSIVTGSYPQIIHEPIKEVTGGTITCSSFVDANGKVYSNRIPAIRLE